MPYTTNLLEIDTEKFKKLTDSLGGYTAVGNKIYRSHSVLSKTVTRGAISKPIAKAIEECFGVPYEAYKKQDEKTYEIKPAPITDLPEIGNQDIKELAILLREVCNNQLAIYKRLNHLTGMMQRFLDDKDTQSRAGGVR